MKTALRLVALLLCGLVGFWALARGIGLVLETRLPGEEDVLRDLIEGSTFIAGGVCVLSVAVEQFYCWRTHHKEDSLL